MLISAFARPSTIHICTLTPSQRDYEDALRDWFTHHGYHLLACSQDPLPIKLQAARSCDLCLLLLGPEFGPQDPHSSFSHSELEASAACDDTSGRLFVITQREVADPMHFPASVIPEQGDFIRRMLHFIRGSFTDICSNADDLLALLPLMIASHWHSPVRKARLQPQINHDAIMISSTGKMADERYVVNEALQKKKSPVIDYKSALSEAVAPVAWVVESARQCRAVFLIVGRDYGSDIPFEGLGATELEFESALLEGRPIYAFLRSDAPISKQNLAHVNPDQAQFVERVRAYLPDNQLFFFQEGTHESTLEDQVYQALDRLAGAHQAGTLPKISDTIRLRWYRRRLKRWMGTLPHLTSKKMMPLEQVYVTLQALPQQRLQQKEELEESLVFANDGGGKAKEEEKKNAKTLNVDDALEQFPRLVLRGNPGSGKSVALHWYALTTDENVTPIFIRLAGYSQALETGQVNSLEGFIMQEERRFLLTPPGNESLWLAHLRGGNGLLLLDALDEVPRHNYRPEEGGVIPLQEKVTTDILEFAKTVHNDSRIALTTRIAGFDPQRLEAVFTITEVQPLTPPQQRQLIRHWLYTTHPDHHQDATLKTIARITDTLQRQANLNSWARTPLMLTLLTALADVRGANFTAETFTKAVVFRQATRLLLAQWGILDERSEGLWDAEAGRHGGQYLWSKEFLLLSLAWQNLEGGRREAITHNNINQIWEMLPPEARQDLAFDDILAELSRTDGFLTPIGERLYSFYHSTFQEYLGAVHLASLPENERRRLLERHRLNEQWEEITQLLVSELDRSGRHAEADAVIETLISAEDQLLHPHSWRDTSHLALARAARCQGVRLPDLARGPTGKKIAEKWGEILRQTLHDFHQQHYIREQACQAILDMGVAAVYAYPDLQAMFEKWKAALDSLGSRNRMSIIRAAFFPSFPVSAIEALGNFQRSEAEQRLRDLLQPEEGIGARQAAALKALIRLGPESARPARDLLIRFIGAQGAMGADAMHSTGELAATLMLQLSPTEEELERIAKLGAMSQQEAIWGTLSLDPAAAIPFLRDHIRAGSISLDRYRSSLDFSEDTYIDARTEALEVARHLGLAAEPLLDAILYRTIFDIERNQRSAEEVFLSFGRRAIPVLKERLFESYNEYVRELYFQDVLQGLESTEDEEEIKKYLKGGINQNRELEKFIERRDAADRDEEIAKKEQGKQAQKANLHRLLHDPLSYRGGPPFRQIVGDVKDYGVGAVEFLEDLSALAINEQVDYEARFAALYQMKDLGPLAGKESATICKLLYNARYRVETFNVLRAMKFAAAPALPHLRRLLHDEDWVARARAAEVIGWLGSAAEEAIPDLIAIVQDRSTQTKNQHLVRKAAVETLGRLGSLNHSYLTDLREVLLSDPHSIVRVAAAKALEQIGDISPLVIEALYTVSGISTSAETNVQEGAARALAALLAKIDISSDIPTSAIAPVPRRRRFWIFRR